ncbi:hypothetical protein [Pseudochrobactrum algeriensis]|uniref:hypothetical protein n=2 Tax=Pseudochrobactrum algeriensis TaxID=2834768 RepID=UPI001BCFE6AA|nr:hypothetical protein [Pseudochrobactrum algeriensis]
MTGSALFVLCGIQRGNQMAEEQLLLFDLTGGGCFLRLVFSEGGCMAGISEKQDCRILCNFNEQRMTVVQRICDKSGTGSRHMHGRIEMSLSDYYAKMHVAWRTAK